jgi:DNA-binding transcriptional MerR regulator
MQISELVRSTGVPLATVKYYLREGLLPAGRKITARSSEYDEGHLRRLVLLRVLRVLGAIPVTRLRELVDATDDRSLSVHAMFARASDAIAASHAPAAYPPVDGRAVEPDATTLVDRVIAQSGWDAVRPQALDRANLVRAVEALMSTGLFRVDEQVLGVYARSADQIAAAEIAALPDDPDRVTQLERMVIGTVAFGEVLATMRRLAEEHHSAQRFASGAS